MHPDDEQDVARRRRTELALFKRALLEAVEDYPAGYPGASSDRLRFLSPVEKVIFDLQEELKKDTP